MPKKMYHGSSRKGAKVLRPSKKGKGKPAGVYATPRKGLAVFFAIKGAGWRNLRREKGRWKVTGLSDKELSSSGSLYRLNPKKFKRYQGWEYISEDSVKVKREERIDNIGKELKSLGFKIN